MSRGWARVGGLLLSLGLVASPVGTAHAKVYRWVDADGVTHYTVEREEAPRRMRLRLRDPGRTPGLREAPRAVRVPETFGPEPAATAPLTDEADAEIRELQAQIERDRGALKQLISRGDGRGIDLAGDPRVREIAERLPRLQSELEALQREAEER